MTEEAYQSEWRTGDALGKLVLRLTLGGLMLFHGLSKLENPGTMDWITGQVTAMGLPDWVAYGVYVGEILAPILIIVGLFSRIGALMIVVNMVFALVIAHSAEFFALTENGGWALELQGFYLFSALAILFMGSGRYALNPD